MKNLLLFALLGILLGGFRSAPSPIKGSWKRSNADGSVTVLVCSEQYLMYSSYELAGKKYQLSGGGSYKAGNAGVVEYSPEFNTADSTTVGKREPIGYQLKTSGLSIATGYLKGTWERLDDGASDMTAAWRISAREGNNGEMTPMQRGARKTIKLLSATRFQWAAINPETKQFFGTGGGTYTIKDGKYTETLEFFSRDNSRVGMALSFDWSLKGKDWDHSGKSSTGGKVHEIWSKED